MRDHARAIQKRPVVLRGLALLAMLLAAVAAMNATGAATPANAATVACGTLPTVAPNDPQKTLAKATAGAKALYNGWPYQLRKSALANWKDRKSVV